MTRRPKLKPCCALEKPARNRTADSDGPTWRNQFGGDPSALTDPPPVQLTNVASAWSLALEPTPRVGGDN
jgi:hypothetical protein